MITHGHRQTELAALDSDEGGDWLSDRRELGRLIHRLVLYDFVSGFQAIACQDQHDRLR